MPVNCYVVKSGSGQFRLLRNQPELYSLKAMRFQRMSKGGSVRLTGGKPDAESLRLIENNLSENRFSEGRAS